MKETNRNYFHARKRGIRGQAHWEKNWYRCVDARRVRGRA